MKPPSAAATTTSTTLVFKKGDEVWIKKGGECVEVEIVDKDERREPSGELNPSYMVKRIVGGSHAWSTDKQLFKMDPTLASSSASAIVNNIHNNNNNNNNDNINTNNINNNNNINLSEMDTEEKEDVLSSQEMATVVMVDTEEEVVLTEAERSLVRDLVRDSEVDNIPLPPPSPRLCSLCHKTATKQILCPCCSLEKGPDVYCSEQCKTLHWPYHKLFCTQESPSSSLTPLKKRAYVRKKKVANPDLRKDNINAKATDASTPISILADFPFCCLVVQGNCSGSGPRGKIVCAHEAGSTPCPKCKAPRCIHHAHTDHNCHDPCAIRLANARRLVLQNETTLNISATPPAPLRICELCISIANETAAQQIGRGELPIIQPPSVFKTDVKLRAHILCHIQDRSVSPPTSKVLEAEHISLVASTARRIHRWLCMECRFRINSNSASGCGTVGCDGRDRSRPDRTIPVVPHSVSSPQKSAVWDGPGPAPTLAWMALQLQNPQHKNLARVPKSLQTRTARTQLRVMMQVIHNRTDTFTMMLHECFFSLIFKAPPQSFRNKRGGTKRGRKATKQQDLIPTFTRRLKQFEKGEYAALFLEVLGEKPLVLETSFELPTKAEIPEPPNLKTLYSRAKTLTGQGRPADALTALTGNGHHKPSVPILALLKTLHPSNDPQPPRPPPNEPDPAPLQVEPHDVQRALNSFKTASAPGLFRNSSDHYKSTGFGLDPAVQEPYWDALTHIVNLLLSGSFPSEFAPYLCGAKLLAMQKPSCSSAIKTRPIAIGSFIRRLTSKVAMAAVAPELADLLQEVNQIGVAVPKGGEALIHSFNAYINTHKHEDLGLLQFDAHNAFNRVSRTVLLKTVRAHPGLRCIAKYVEFNYQDPTLLHYHGHVIQSAAGVQQGDPLGPGLFSMVLRELLLAVRALLAKESPDDPDLEGWFMDDGALVATPKYIGRFLRAMIKLGPEYGIYPNLTKSTVWWWNLHQPSARARMKSFLPVIPGSSPEEPQAEVTILEADGTILLGCPIGGPDFCREYIKTRVSRVDGLVSMIEGLDDSQIQLLLLRLCVGFPRIVYALRTANPEWIQEELKAFDEIIIRAVTDITGQLTKLAITQIRLPTRNGGLGLSSAVDTADVAFVAGVFGSQKLQQQMLERTQSFTGPILSLDSPPPSPQDSDSEYEHHLPQTHQLSTPPGALEALSRVRDKVKTNRVPSLTPTPNNTLSDPPSQHNLTQWINEDRFESFKNSCSQSDRARINSLTGPNAMAFLHTLPITYFGFKVPTEEYTIILRFVLGLNTFPAGASCFCGKASGAPNTTDHALTCLSGGDRIYRHNKLRDLIYKLASQAGWCPQLEKPIFPTYSSSLFINTSIPITNSRSRPADILITNANGNPLGLDVGITHPGGVSVVDEAAETQGTAAERYRNHKVGHYIRDPSHTGDPQAKYFLPLIFETYGYMDKATMDFLCRLSRGVATARRQPLHKVRQLIFQQISHTLMRHNAAMLLHRMPIQPHPIPPVLILDNHPAPFRAAEIG
jgi:hypothetical protein